MTPSAVDSHALRFPAARAASRRLTGVDGVRALACLWVFASHASVLPALAGHAPRLLRLGGMGVPVFFVLSGFLLSIPFWQARATNHALPPLGPYFLRRLARIIPAYFACILILTVALNLWASKWNLVEVFTCLTFTSHLFPATYTPRFDGPLWSVSVEMWFYVLLPLAAWLGCRAPTRSLARLFIVVMMADLALAQTAYLHLAPLIEKSAGLPAYLFHATASSTTKNVPTLFAQFLAGVLAADVYLSLSRTAKAGVRVGDPQSRPLRAFNRFDVVVLVSLAIILLGLQGVLRWPALASMGYGWPTFQLLIGTLLVCLPLSARAGRLFDLAPLRLTATLSYGIYIWHMPAMDLLGRIWPTASLSTFQSLVWIAGAFAGAYLLAALSYYTLERPILRWMEGRLRPAAPVAGRLTTAIPRQAAA